MAVLLVAQQPAADQDPQMQELARFQLTFQQVLVPTLVFDKKNSFINGLVPNQFRLFDNGKEQNLTSVDVTYLPISLVVAIQANNRVDKILNQVNKVGPLLKPILLGDAGEAAVVAFDSRVRVLQNFTSDGDQLSSAIKSIKAGSQSSRLIDGVVRERPNVEPPRQEPAPHPDGDWGETGLRQRGPGEGDAAIPAIVERDHLLGGHVAHHRNPDRAGAGSAP